MNWCLDEVFRTESEWDWTFVEKALHFRRIQVQNIRGSYLGGIQNQIAADFAPTSTLIEKRAKTRERCRNNNNTDNNNNIEGIKTTLPSSCQCSLVSPSEGGTEGAEHSHIDPHRRKPHRYPSGGQSSRRLLVLG